MSLQIYNKKEGLHIIDFTELYNDCKEIVT